MGPGVAVRPVQQKAGVAAALPDMRELSEGRRARRMACVKGNDRMPQETKDRVLAQLAEREVPAQMVARIESRMGG